VIPMGFVARGGTPIPTVIGGTYKTNQFVGNYLLSYDVVRANTVSVMWAMSQWGMRLHDRSGGR